MRTPNPTEVRSNMREEERTPLQVAFERRNKDLDPQLVWRGKDLQDLSDLVVPAPALYIQEKVHPKVLIDDLRRQSESTHKTAENQFSLFADLNGVPEGDAKTEFYQHDVNWTNRMIFAGLGGRGLAASQTQRSSPPSAHRQSDGTGFRWKCPLYGNP